MPKGRGKKRKAETYASTDESEEHDDPKDPETSGKREWEVGTSGKRLRVNVFKDAVRVDIRQCWMNNGEWAPTKKGINMNTQEFYELLDILRGEDVVSAVEAEKAKLKK